MISQGEHLAAALLPLRAPGARLARRAHGAAAEAFRIVGVGDQHLRPREGLECLFLVGGDWNIRKVGLLTYQNGCFMGFNGWLVVWNIWMIFHSVGNVIIPTGPNSIIFQMGGSTTNQLLVSTFLRSNIKCWLFKSQFAHHWLTTSTSCDWGIMAALQYSNLAKDNY